MTDPKCGMASPDLSPPARRAAARSRQGRRRHAHRCTAQGDALDDYERVKAWLDGVNRVANKRGIYNTKKTLPDGRTYTVPAPPLSATEIIRSALRLAAGAIER